MDESRLEEADRLRYDGEYEQAIEIYDQLIADSAEDPELYKAKHGRGLAYCFIGLFDESIEELEQVRDLNRTYLKGREDLFKTYLMLGMNDEAKGEMIRVWKLDPGNEEVAKAAEYFPGFYAEADAASDEEEA